MPITDTSIAAAIQRARGLKKQGKSATEIAAFLNDNGYDKLKRDGEEHDWTRQDLQRFGIR